MVAKMNKLYVIWPLTDANISDQLPKSRLHALSSPGIGNTNEVT